MTSYILTTNVLNCLVGKMTANVFELFQVSKMTANFFDLFKVSKRITYFFDLLKVSKMTMSKYTVCVV